MASWLHQQPGGFVVDADFDFSRSTQDNYNVPGDTVSGPHAAIREKLDFGYHGNYSERRIAFQDLLVGNVVGAGQPKENPWIVFSAGAMGAGKTFVVSWLSDRGYFPLEDIVHIDMDRFRKELPEWPGYNSRDSMTSGRLTHREAGYLMEIAQAAAMQVSVGCAIWWSVPCWGF